MKRTLGFILPLALSVIASSVNCARAEDPLANFSLPGFGGLPFPPRSNVPQSETPDPAQVNKLPSFSIDTQDVTISGLSAGAFLSVQMHLAHSEMISGAAAIAGGIYWCAEGTVGKAFSQCMYVPSQIKVDTYVKKARDEAAAGRIAPLENLTRSRVYIFSGVNDKVVNPLNGSKLQEFYTKFVPAGSIHFVNNVNSGHGFPTIDYGNNCDQGKDPWMNKCNYDAAGEILAQMYGRLSDPVTPKPENLIAFDQTEFNSGAASMDKVGYAYVPTACAARTGAPCKLHIALHGCEQSPEYVGDAFRVHAGYNRWAESNRIIILYPTMTKTGANNYACWDWFGYTGADYATRKGVQIQVLASMIKRIAGAAELR